jgi:hypothetical protein
LLPDGRIVAPANVSGQTTTLFSSVASINHTMLATVKVLLGNYSPQPVGAGEWLAKVRGVHLW